MGNYIQEMKNRCREKRNVQFDGFFWCLSAECRLVVDWRWIALGCDLVFFGVFAGGALVN